MFKWMITALALLGLYADAQTQSPSLKYPPPPALEAVFEQSRPATLRVITENGHGSGFFYSRDGYLLTAYHVIAGADEVRVMTPSGQVWRAEVLGYDESRDLAVAKAQVSGAVRALELSSEEGFSSGEWVLNIGNSRGQLNAPRSGRVENTGITLSPLFPKDLVASTMPLAPGDSGGAVLNTAGRVVGVAVAVSRDEEGRGRSYFVSLKGLQSVVQALAGGYTQRWPVLGIQQGISVDGEVAARLGIPRGGVIFMGLGQGGPAQAVGLQPTLLHDTRYGLRVDVGDIIVGINQKPVQTLEELLGEVHRHRPGDTVTLTVRRSNQTLEVALQLGR